MAGVITHMVIAKEMLKLLPEGTIQNLDLFYLGTLAPDAVHARIGYERAHKKHTHFRDGIPDSDFELPENYALYRKRLRDFISCNRERTDGLLDLYRGYVVHILTDELFVLSIRKEFCKRMECLEIGQEDRRFFEAIVTDQNRNDLLLVYGYEDMEELRKHMEEAAIYPVEGMVSEQELEDSRVWLIDHHFIKKHELLQPAYITYDRTLDFIYSAAERIVNMMSGEEDLPKM
ncbi:MAG TPA: hypothetical protein GXX75_17395 [Clostridiales bacterium]|nr:hypothetical protein [Clostridiales bacterium]